MEIREITEGAWDAVKAVGGAITNAALGGQPGPLSQADAAKTLAAFQKKYGGGASPEVTWQAALEKIKTDPVSTQWINGVVASWSQAAPGVLAKAVEKTADKAAADKEVEPTITVGGEEIRPDDPRYAAFKAAAEKAEAKNKSKPGPTVSPAVTEAAAAPGAVDEEIYIDEFTDWATRNFNSLLTIMGEYDDLKLKLDDLAKKIFANRDQPTKQTPLVRDYLNSALAGNQALGQQNRLWKNQRASSLRGSTNNKKTSGAGGATRIEVDPSMKLNIETQVKNMERQGLTSIRGQSTKNPVIDKFLRYLGFKIP